MPNGERLLRSMQCIEAWGRAAINHEMPFGNDNHAALVAIIKEAQCAIEVESEVKE